LAREYPVRCVSEDPAEVWRDDVPDDGGAECPVYLGREFEAFFLAWTMKEKSLLPVTGGWAEQPFYYVQAFEILDAAVGRAQRDRLRQVER
jgi:hypothetical protein